MIECDYCGFEHEPQQACDTEGLKENIDGLCVAVQHIAEDRDNAWTMVEEQAAIISALITVIEQDGSEVVIQGLDEFTHDGKLH